MPAPFTSYEEIPLVTKEYILTVADAKTVTEIPLEDINSFLMGLEAFDKSLLSEYDEGGGWVL